jgi:hypothetical protein
MTPDEIRLLKEQEQLQQSESIKKRMEEGKRGRLWHISVYYEIDKEKKVVHVDNLFVSEMKAYRENIFSIGLMVPVDGKPSSWRVIPPKFIGEIYISLQSKFFE